MSSHSEGNFCNRWQPLLFQISESAKTSRKSVICGLPALQVARVRVLGADHKKSGLWGRDWYLIYLGNTLKDGNLESRTTQEKEPLTWICTWVNRRFSITWKFGHVGAQNNSNLRLMFCIIIESNSQKMFFSIVLFTNMAAVTSGENHQQRQRSTDCDAQWI